MIPLALISAVCGAALGRWLNVLVLVPASLLLLIVAFAVGWIENFSIFTDIIMSVGIVICLQLGYLVGAAFAGVRRAYRKRRRVMAVH